MDYDTFLKSKRLVVKSVGKTISPDAVNPILFPFQRDLVVWACRKGRAAIFADTGLGKSFMQLEWARLMAERTLIIAPLSVAKQTVSEGAKLGITVEYDRTGTSTAQIVITNYEMAHKFNPDDFQAVVLDESSILKSLDGKTRKALTLQFADTPYKLCCTATPAPNDISEMGNHAEFLSIMKNREMTAAFFVHDEQEYRLKGHAVEPFFRWLASWGMSIRKPSDLGYSDEGYDLPPLTITPQWVDYEYTPAGQLFNTGLKGITDRSHVRRETLQARGEVAAALVNSSSSQWIVWVGLNSEGDLMQKLIPDAVQIEGSQSVDEKIARLEKFQSGEARVLITKTSITGFGVNLQNCHDMVFVGLSDSWEQYYQAIRRCYRFGQTEPVSAYVVLSHIEHPIYDNIQNKEREARHMSDELIKNVAQYEKGELSAKTSDTWQYSESTIQTDLYTLRLGDSAERMREIESESIDLSVSSIPFLSLYTYTPTERDLGNCKTTDEFFEHFRFMVDEWLRITRPGRLACVHVAQVAATKQNDGYIGMKDFRGDTIRFYESRGWIYHGEVCIDKDPQAQAIRTKAKGLLFVSLDKDSTWLRPAYADYILLFKKPGENAVPVQPVQAGEMTREDWIHWARPIWYGIRETETLSVAEARDEKDERHIAPLQLGTIERCIKLWSNKGEVVFDPFGGIGSTGYMALKLGRKTAMNELNPNYFKQMVANASKAAKDGTYQLDLLSMMHAVETE